MAAEAHVGSHSGVANINVHDIGGGHDHGKGHGGANGRGGKSGAEAKPAPSVFNVEEFKQPADIAPERGKKLIGKDRAPVERKVKVSPETIGQYSDFLKQHIAVLKNVDNKLLEDLGFQSDLMLKAQFLDGRGDLKPDAFNTFFDARGLAITTMVLEQQMALGRLVVGWGTENEGKGRKAPQQERWAFEMLSKDSKLAEYVKKTTNIDVNDFQWASGINSVMRKFPSLRSGSHVSTSPDTTALKGRLKQMKKVRNDFLEKDLRVPKDRINKPAEQGLKDLKLNETGLLWDREITDEFMPNEGGVQWIGGNLDHEGNLRRYIQAREAVVAKRLTDKLERMSAHPEIQNSRLKKLDELKTEVSGGSQEHHRKKVADKDAEIAVVTLDRDSANGAKVTLDDVGKRRQAVEFAKGKARAELGVPTGKDEAEYIQEDIDAEKKKIDDLTDTTSFKSRENKAKADAANARAKVSSHPDVIAAIPTEKTKAGDAVREQIQIDFDEEWARIQKDRENSGVDKTIAELEKYKKDIKDAETALIDAEFQRATQETVDQLVKNFADLQKISVTDTTVTPHNVISIEDVDLRTLTPEQILKKINDIRELSVKLGNPAYESWPESENVANRQRVIFAMAEARASLDAGFPPVGYETYRSYGLSETQIVTFTDEQINKYMNDLYIRSGKGWDSGENGTKKAEIDVVRAFGLTKLQKRSEHLDDLAKAANSELPKLMYERDQIKPSVDDEKKVDMAKKLIDGKGGIYATALNINQNIDMLTDTRAASTHADPLESPSEVAPGRMKWEIAWAQMLTDYQSKGKAGREDEFNEAMNYLKPDEAVRFVVDTLGLGIASGAPIVDVLQAFEESVKGVTRTGAPSALRRVTPVDFRNALKDYINNYADKTITEVS